MIVDISSDAEEDLIEGYWFYERQSPGLGDYFRSCLIADIESRPTTVGSVLGMIRLSPSRYHNWNRTQQCDLDDRSSCLQLSPHQLTAAEVKTIHELVTSDQYRLVRDNKWRRPRQRVHPAAPKVGIRASRPNEIWHIDTTLIRLLDESRAYLHAVIDNFSRRILSWKLCSPGSSSITRAVAR